jgi:hypothetical protein
MLTYFQVIVKVLLGNSPGSDFDIADQFYLIMMLEPIAMQNS